MTQEGGVEGEQATAHEPIVVGGVEIAPDTSRLVHVPVARLPTGTLIDLTAYVARGPQPGPTLLVQGGLHGDELNGIEICRRLIDDGLAAPTSGAIIVAPVLNVYGFLHLSREVPDGKDVNRSFPGSKRGSLASRVAHACITHVLAAADVAIDLHTGGGLRHNHPQVRYTEGEAESARLGEVFNAPVRMPTKVIAKSFRAAAGKLGVPVIVFEGGETQRIETDVVEEGLRGVRRVMAHLGMIDEGPAPQPSLHLTKSRWHRAPNAGMWRAAVAPGQQVTKGEVMGQVVDPYGEHRATVKAWHDGWVITLNHQAVVTGGDALVRVGWADDA